MGLCSTKGVPGAGRGGGVGIRDMVIGSLLGSSRGSGEACELLWGRSPQVLLKMTVLDMLPGDLGAGDFGASGH